MTTAFDDGLSSDASGGFGHRASTIASGGRFTDTKPRLLDLFCGAGGAAMGYHRAGFKVVGVDIEPQPRYPFEFIQGDALECLADLAAWPLTIPYHAVHASPPCQAYSIANNIHGRTDHPDLVGATRDLLVAAGLPYVIENVAGSPLRNPVMVCGLALGLNVKRHRLFECTFPVMVPPCTGHDRDFLMVFGGGARRRVKQSGRTANNGPILRRGTAPLSEAREAMGIDWMIRDELSQAIPPAYTEHIGHYLLAEIKTATRNTTVPVSVAARSPTCTRTAGTATRGRKRSARVAASRCGTSPSTP